ncbi:dehydrogenase/reductase SDR family member on chromosome X isoform X2 [Oenanthe melanoleuca]|uniref:dehydrogenase/reductase SDR family member on chromosome X isoform X2 n=1 Tax=Oenanthe melanoleuca TaxID=2939378 RepID=UPI0024C1EDE5|nr:dehydrogenase/reductase SDR family member on chromosome X isoform X2 [Oenanthe melanoleuca]
MLLLLPPLSVSVSVSPAQLPGCPGGAEPPLLPPPRPVRPPPPLPFPSPATAHAQKGGSRGEPGRCCDSGGAFPSVGGWGPRRPPARPGPAETLRRPPARPAPSPPRPEPAAAAGREAAMSLLSALVPLLRVYCIGLRVILHQLRRRFQPRCAPASVFPTQNGKVAIVTGGTKGIGYQTVKHLARLGMHVIIAGNSESDGQEAVRKIKEETLTGKVEFLYCDLASMKSIRQFVQQFRAKNCPLHVLVNNAGVMLVPERKTEDGFEEHFGLNYLGHFLLTNLLLDTLEQSGTHRHNARIITVSSATHYVGKLHLNDLQSRPQRKEPLQPSMQQSRLRWKELVAATFTMRKGQNQLMWHMMRSCRECSGQKAAGWLGFLMKPTGFSRRSHFQLGK